MTDQKAKISRAVARLERLLKETETPAYNAQKFHSSSDVKTFIKARLFNEEREIFIALYLTTQHALIECVTESTGTIDCASVYPREIVKRALALNASAVIIAHNHPSGESFPSSADLDITKRIKDALGLLDIRVLDHIIAAKHSVYSFAESGKI